VPNLTSTKAFTDHTNPGAPGNNTGPSWTRGQHDNLMLPNGSTVGQTDNETLRRLLAPFVDGAHTKPRNEIVEIYWAALKRIHDDAGNAAVNAWLQEKRG